MSVPDVLSGLRALAVIPTGWLIAVDERGAAFAVFVAAALTDAVDGALARRTGATRLGALLDPLADKILTVGALAALSAAAAGWPVTVVAILVGARELVAAAARVRAYARGQALPAERLAKMKTAAELGGTAMVIWGERPWPVLGCVLVGVGSLVGLYTLPRLLRPAGPPR